MNTISLTPAAAGHAPVGSPPPLARNGLTFPSPVGADATGRSAAQGRGRLRVREQCAAAPMRRSFSWRDWRYTSTYVAVLSPTASSLAGTDQQGLRWGIAWGAARVLGARSRGVTCGVDWAECVLLRET